MTIPNFVTGLESMQTLLDEKLKKASQLVEKQKKLQEREKKKEETREKLEEEKLRKEQKEERADREKKDQENPGSKKTRKSRSRSLASRGKKGNRVPDRVWCMMTRIFVAFASRSIHPQIVRITLASSAMVVNCGCT